MLFLGITTYAFSGPVGAFLRLLSRRRAPAGAPVAQVVLDKPGAHS
jgi:hypothetical protein